MAQDAIEGKVTPGLKEFSKVKNWKEVEMEVAEIYEDFNDNYKAVKQALTTLSKKTLEYEDDKIWKLCQIIVAPEVKKDSGKMVFRVVDDIWHCILDFSKGFSRYEIKVALSLKSVYSMRMYEYCSGQKRAQKMDHGFEIQIDTLRQMFRIGDKYKNTNDFLRRTLGVAKAELDKCSPWTFEYGIPIDGKKGKGGKIQKVWIKPIEQPQFVDQDLKRKTLTSKLTSRNALDIINPELYKWLREELRWPAASITSNKQNIVEAQNVIPDLYDRLPIWVARWETANAKNPKKYPSQIAYVIGAMKDEVRQFKGEASVTRPPIQKSIFDDDLPY